MGKRKKSNFIRVKIREKKGDLIEDGNDIKIMSHECKISTKGNSLHNLFLEKGENHFNGDQPRGEYLNYKQYDDRIIMIEPIEIKGSCQKDIAKLTKITSL